MILQGEVWWANLPLPAGSEPGYRHPVIVVQSNAFNHSGIRTVVCVLVTSNLRLAQAPGNVFLETKETGLPRPSVANVSQVVSLDKSRFQERVSRLPPPALEMVFQGIHRLLGRCAPRRPPFDPVSSGPCACSIPSPWPRPPSSSAAPAHPAPRRPWPRPRPSW